MLAIAVPAAGVAADRPLPGDAARGAAPHLAGQSATCLANAIGERRTGMRHGGEKQLGPVVARLDDQDMAALSKAWARPGPPRAALPGQIISSEMIETSLAILLRSCGPMLAG
jgi:hypothetical protein